METIFVIVLDKNFEPAQWPARDVFHVIHVKSERDFKAALSDNTFDIIVIEESFSLQRIRRLPSVCLSQRPTMTSIDSHLVDGYDDVWSYETLLSSDFLGRCHLLMAYAGLIEELDDERESSFRLIDALKSGKIDRIPSDASPSGAIRLIDEKLVRENERLLKNIEKKTQLLEEIAHFDALTDLPNRRQFNKALKREVARAHRHNEMMALLFIDLDKFKSINDTMGHDVGDLLLQEVATRLQHCIREEDLVARIAGDEFAVILSDIKQVYNAGRAAQKIVEQLSAPFHCGGRALHVSGSVGIACYPYAGGDTETLTKHADIAMYTAKEQGRNNYQYFTNELNGLHVQRLKMETDLRSAISAKALFLEYQPIVDLTTKSVQGYEALVRWTRNGEVVYPDHFIMIAEETGMIVDIGRWVIEQACHDLIHKGFPDNCVMSINLSTVQLTQNDISTILLKSLEGIKSKLKQVQLEITETAMMPNIDEIQSTILELANEGVQFAIDDFGTGFSSMSYLRHLPVNTLKIDQSFVADIVSDENSRLITKSIIDLANNLRLKSVAEGVETQEQHDLLLELGCESGQGYLYGKPSSDLR